MSDSQQKSSSTSGISRQSIPFKEELRAIRREWRDARGLLSIAGRAYGRGVAFVHVPKCAGRSVERGLRKKFPLSRGHVHAGFTFDHAVGRMDQEIVNQDDRQAALQMASDHRSAVYAYHLAAGLKCVTGHAPVNAEILRLYADSHLFVTVLRDPVERFISHFKYSYQSSGQGSIDIELEAFLKTARARTFGSMYRKYFAHGTTAKDAEPEIRDCLMRFGAVGFVDAMPDFEASVSGSLGRKVSFGHVNATSQRRKPAPSALDPDLMSEISKNCEPDMAIYQWSLSQFK